MAHRPSTRFLSFVEILVLAPLAGVLAFWAIPNVFDIGWSCTTSLGVQGTGGDAFAHGVAVAGTFGWVLVLIGMLFAYIAERPRLATLLPLAWFVLLVGTVTIVAAAIGPAPCPA